MTDELVIDVDAEEVEGRLRAVLERALAILDAGARPETLEGKRQRDALVSALREDAASVALLEGAWREGGRDKALQVARAGAVPELDVRPVDPSWGDVGSEGELMARRREEHACERCVHGSVCAVATLPTVSDLAVVVSRCASFLTSRAGELDSGPSE